MFIDRIERDGTAFGRVRVSVRLFVSILTFQLTEMNLPLSVMIIPDFLTNQLVHGVTRHGCNTQVMYDLTPTIRE